MNTSPDFVGYQLYLITNNINGKQYIGQTIRKLSHRYAEHCSSVIAKGSLIQRAIHKYGKDNFTMVLIQTCNSQEELDKAEIDAIIKYNTQSPNGYNLSLGGKGGSKSLETRAKMRIANKRPHKEETKRKLRYINTGKTLSDATKKKISETLKRNGHRKGAPFTEEHKRNIGKASRGRQFSPESIQLISEKLSGENNPNFGKKRSDEYKQKMSEKMKEIKKGQPRRKLNEEKVKEIKILLRQKKSITSISKIYGVSFETISDINKGRTWKHVILEEDSNAEEN
jgi:group I intron endonuclease